MKLVSNKLRVYINLFKANKANKFNEWQLYIYYFSQALKYGLRPSNKQCQQFVLANESFKLQRKEDGNKVAVFCWDLSHNAAGRALALADLYNFLGLDTSIIGSIVSENPKRPKTLWEPIQLADINCEFFTVTNSLDLWNKAFDFVSRHPFDIVHLSKPRLPSIIIGRLYELVWGANVIMDVDDEELGFSTLQSSSNSSSKPNKSDLKSIRNNYWLNKCISHATSFDALTVSNVSLQNKYGGTIVPHVRNADRFKPSIIQKTKMRAHYGINPNQKVVLFFGTPKPHKGLVETANAIAELNSKDILFLIVGEFIDKKFEKKLKSIRNVNFKFLPNQPFSEIPNIVVMGDICVLLLQKSSVISQYQLPAKLIDALAMGLTVISSRTLALEPFIEAGIVIESEEAYLKDTLKDVLATNSDSINYKNRNYFLEHLSTQSNVETISNIIQTLPKKRTTLQPSKKYTLKSITMQQTCTNGSYV